MSRRKAKKPKKTKLKRPPKPQQPQVDPAIIAELHDQFVCFGGDEFWDGVLKRNKDEWEEAMGGRLPDFQKDLQSAQEKAEAEHRRLLSALMKKYGFVEEKPWEWVNDITVDYVDLLDKVYIYRPKSSLAAAELTRWKIAQQRNIMKQYLLHAKTDFMTERWEDAVGELKDLFADFLEELSEPAMKQIKQLEELDYQFRINNAATFSKNSDLLPKELVARQLLFEESPTESTLKFISENFTREEFRDFARKIRALKKCNRIQIAPKRTNEHRMVSKRALLNDIALRVKQYSKTFEALLLPDPWPHGILAMLYSSEEIELIISICYSLSPRFDRTFEKTLNSFSYSELENFGYKVDYRINAILNYQASRNILTVKLSLFSKKVTSDSKPHKSTRKPFCRRLEAWEFIERKELIKSITQRILEPKIQEMTMFLLLPEISDKLTCEEKRFIISVVNFKKEPHPCLDSLELLRRFAEKLTIFEKRLEKDLNELLIDEISTDNLLSTRSPDTEIFSECYSKKGSRRNLLVSPEEDSEFSFDLRRIENDYLVMIMSKVWIYNNYDFADPIQRIQFNKDFRTVVSNRSLMWEAKDKLLESLNSNRIANFYNTYINCFSKKKTDFVSYDDFVLQVVDREKEEPYVPLEKAIIKDCMKILFPPHPDDIPKYVNYDNYTIYNIKRLKIPTSLRVQGRRSIKRRIKKNDPIRLARLGKKTIPEYDETGMLTDWMSNFLEKLPM